MSNNVWLVCRFAELDLLILGVCQVQICFPTFKFLYFLNCWNDNYASLLYILLLTNNISFFWNVHFFHWKLQVACCVYFLSLTWKFKYNPSLRDTVINSGVNHLNRKDVITLRDLDVFRRLLNMKHTWNYNNVEQIKILLSTRFLPFHELKFKSPENQWNGVKDQIHN